MHSNELLTMLSATVNICRSNLQKINLNLELCCEQDGVDSQNYILYFCKSTCFVSSKIRIKSDGVIGDTLLVQGITVAFEGWTNNSLVKNPTLVENLSSVQYTRV